jgi:cobalt-precorrin-5B (C1)-methyltransferase
MFTLNTSCSVSMPEQVERAGLILPVWGAAAARAALVMLIGHPSSKQLQSVEIKRGERRLLPIEAVAALRDGSALAMVRCDPGTGVLDLTRGLLLWARVRLLDGPGPWLALLAGEGVGLNQSSGEACMSVYARNLLEWNLRPLLPSGRRLELELTIPEGRLLAARTSNAAFGVVDGLALIGTQAEVQRSAAPDQLAAVRAELVRRAAQPGGCLDLVLVIGENGLDLAPQLGLPPALLLKAGNWLGPALVAAAEQGVRRLLLFGYQGKVIKLAGGIFHTHHHLADGRREVLTALAALQGLSTAQLQRLYVAASVEEALQDLERQEPAAAVALRARVAAAVEERTDAYLARYGQTVGAVLFDRSRRLCAEGPLGAELLKAFRARDLG